MSVVHHVWLSRREFLLFPPAHMKYCPSCLNQYTDLTLKFCLQDGTPLSAMPEKKQSTIDTVAFVRPVTAENFMPTADIKLEQPRENATQQNIRPAQVRNAKRTSRALIAVAVILPITVISVAGIGSGWYLLRGRLATLQAESTMPVDPPAEPATADVSPAVPETVTVGQPREADTVKSQIRNLVEQWKDLTEGHNAERLSRMYGEKVDYYGKPGTRTEEVRAELEKTFDAYSEIDVEISNLSIAVDSESTAATALFDNEWIYAASPKLSSGKAHTKLHFQRVGTDWKIVSEKQLKVYFKEN